MTLDQAHANKAGHAALRSASADEQARRAGQVSRRKEERPNHAGHRTRRTIVTLSSRALQGKRHARTGLPGVRRTRYYAGASRGIPRACQAARQSRKRGPRPRIKPTASCQLRVVPLLVTQLRPCSRRVVYIAWRTVHAASSVRTAASTSWLARWPSRRDLDMSSVRTVGGHARSRLRPAVPANKSPPGFAMAH